MSRTKLNEFSVVLERDGHQIPWGIRLVGGSDLDTPLIITKVQIGSPAQSELIRGDIVTKIDEYDSRDLRHSDAQHLFKNAGNRISLVIQRDHKTAAGLLNGLLPKELSTIPNLSPINHVISPIPPQLNVPYRTTSPAAAKAETPFQALPQTVFPPAYQPGVGPAKSPASPKCFSPQPSRDYQVESEEEMNTILNQPYRTTPLILPGAKVKRDAGPTESYLRHHPNPAMRAHPQHENLTDYLMKQKVADSVLHRVVGDDPNKVIKKQFNSPIGLYSDQNIEKAIHQTVPYKKTVVYDPLKSETYRAIQEDSFGYSDKVHEVAHPVQTKVFHHNRMVPAKKPNPSYPPPNPQSHHIVNTMGSSGEDIHQSGSFKRLMYSVLGETDY